MRYLSISCQRDPKNIFYHQRDVENYTGKVLIFLLFDKYEYTHGTLRSVILVSILILPFMQLFLCSSRFDWHNQSSFLENNFSEELASYGLLTQVFSDESKKAAFTGMALRILLSRNYGGKSLVSIKCHNLHSFKEGVIPLCNSIFKTRRISHLHGSAPFTVPLHSLFQSSKTDISDLSVQKCSWWSFLNMV